ncbi:ATP-grasp domain-containing protein [Micromonospora sp. CA-246542]|uniref:ATP-grasp domain-containing protein n=1 Tax=Micromonospora sp. CA-246542 TaxID=3239959 RepID=UPI003D8E1480
MTQSFVLLEMMNPMLLVAQEAKRRGMRIVVLNREPLRATGPYAVPEGFVDELISMPPWSDTAAVEAHIRDVHERHDVGGTYAGFEPTLPYDAMLRELAGLPHNDPSEVRGMLDKRAVRRRLYDDGLSGLRSASLAEALTWDDWRFPGRAVVKPANGTGSALCFVVSSVAELREAAATAGRVAVANGLMRDYIEANGSFVVEGEASGELLSVESVVHDGQVRSIGLMGRYVLRDDPVVEMGFQFPYPHPRLPDIFAKADEVHHSLGFRHGATQMEMMVPDEGPIELIDFNPRLAGTASIVLFSEAYGTRFEEVLTDLGCGRHPDLSFLSASPRSAAEMILLPPPDETRFDSIDFAPGTFCHRLPKPPGTPLSGRADQLDSVGMFVITANTPVELHEAALRARRDTKVNGRPLGDNQNNVLAWSPYIGRNLPDRRPEALQPAGWWEAAR